MAKIEFSPAFAGTLPSRIANLTDSYSGGSSFASLIGTYGASGREGGNNYKLLMIFKGTKLTRADMENSRNFATANTPLKLAITNDLLVSFNNTGSNHFTPSVIDTNKVTINTNYVAASSTGSASWFLYFNKDNDNLTSGTLANFIIGDVGITGSGADLIIADTNIVAGELNRVTGWKLKFPSSWEY